MWAIFGEDSGHCYGQYMSEDEANDALDDHEELVRGIS